MGFATLLGLAPFFAPRGADGGEPSGPRMRPIVFGADDRQLFDVKERPWSAVGRLELHPVGLVPSAAKGDVTICTATLVGPDLLLTNAHCVLDGKTGKLRDEAIWFRAGLSAGQSLGEARATRVWLGTRDPDRQRGRDWAILRIDVPLGDALGWLPVASVTDTELERDSRTVTFVSYSSDFLRGSKPSIQTACKTMGIDDLRGFLRHDCDMDTGASGSPIVERDARGGASVIAINAAYMGRTPVRFLAAYNPRRANVAVTAARFKQTLDALLAEDRGLPAPSMPQVSAPLPPGEGIPTSSAL